jgi:hypothetical protein|tara:strand:- start:858 stop:1061 length:204 start_codon:yes stop_codon:yes gene_type:complete
MSELPWNYCENVSAEECLIRLESKLSPIINSIHESDGDMMLSEYRDLLELGFKLKRIVLEMKETEDE